MVRPVPTSIPITLGYRQRMKSRPSYIHRGIDYGCPTGTKVVATKAGTVVHAGRGGMGSAFGIHVVLKTSGVFHIYAHLSSEVVKVGQRVDTGQHVGRSGATGNVTGPHLHYGEFTTYSYTADRKPQFIDYKPAAAKPVSKGPWFTIGSYNLKSPTLTRSGKHKWTLRRPRQIRNIEAANVDVLCIQEEGSPTDVAWYDPQLKKLDLGRVAGNRWRYIYTNSKTTKTIAAGVVELAPLYQGDTKPMPWWAGEIRGSYTLVGDLHLEEANGAKPDAIRPDQATDAVVELKKIAAHIKATKGIDIPRDRWVFAGDTNSEAKVADRMDDRHGFVSALTNAAKSSGSKYATFNNWVKNRLGRHVDYIFVDQSRPVESWTQKSDSIAADHNFIYATLGRKA